ncbi:STYKc [Geosmithia morbida]|uniref:STYKc n=1 Tax=Geosmithia morbida TaxID=1094350 RepID=A0A9P4YUR2_9HYPO|nr:STYKc [Geosmithia morbida]KAF4123165.1 STYKc [Geosmithia morbida]
MEFHSADSSQDTPVALLRFSDTRCGDKSNKTIPICGHEILKIGRHAGSNNFVIQPDLNYAVSRNHCEVYVVVYEADVHHVYVRDRKSVNGTYVNDFLIGSGVELSQGYLLQHGDVIEIKPFSRTSKPNLRGLTDIQQQEAQFFAHKYQLTDYCLGQGAEASVFLAIDASTKKQLSGWMNTGEGNAEQMFDVNFKAPTFFGSCNIEFFTSTGVQTSAVDIWSLGVVALALITSVEVIRGHLNLMGQQDLDRRLIRCFENASPRPTSNAQDFIVRCLRVAPEERLTATAAACHDWMCTPRKHLEFFRRFDERVISHWTPQSHLKPMPWELQSLRDAAAEDEYRSVGRAAGAEQQEDDTCVETASSYFPEKEDDDELSLVPMPMRPKLPTPIWDQAETPATRTIHSIVVVFFFFFPSLPTTILTLTLTASNTNTPPHLIPQSHNLVHAPDALPLYPEDPLPPARGHGLGVVGPYGRQSAVPVPLLGPVTGQDGGPLLSCDRGGFLFGAAAGQRLRDHVVV